MNSLRYGIPYKGSKNRIAKWVVDNLPASDTLVDLFAGGCAVTHAAILSNKWKRVIANDLLPAPNVFQDAARGKFHDADMVTTREQFSNSSDFATRLIYSFGNEAYLHNGGTTESMRRLQGLESLERLQGLERIESLEGLQGFEVSNLDYRDVKIPSGATVYADPPYRGTSQSQYGGTFDHEKFDAWLAEVDFPVYVSEYTCPSGCVEIARVNRTWR